MLIGVSVLAFGFVVVSAWLWQTRRFQLKSWLGALALVAWVVGVGVKVHVDQRAEARVAALPSIAWPTSAIERGLGAPTSSDGAAPVPVAPVSSLVAGLEQRLAAQPEDDAGWALLAQSYAFMGDAAAANGALKKAVALGMNEQELRSRLDAAMRGPHSN